MMEKGAGGNFIKNYTALYKVLRESVPHCMGEVCGTGKVGYRHMKNSSEWWNEKVNC